MVDLNKAIIDGISDIDCDENVAKFLEKILKYELQLSDDKNSTKTKISQQYREWIENYSGED